MRNRKNQDAKERRNSMLTTSLTLAEKYDYLGEKFKKAFTFLRETDLTSLPLGNVAIDGDDIYANVQSYTTMPASECAFESHRAYFDIQYMVEGEEIFGYEPIANLTPSTEYNEMTDLIFYEEPDESGAILLKKGDFAIVPPEDAHAPRRMSKKGACEVRKIVVKVRV